MTPKFWAGLVFAAIATPALAQAIAEQSGFSIHQIDAEAGQHPDRPAPGDQRVLSVDGHAYWLKPDPVLVGDIAGVRVTPDRYGGSLIWLRLTPEGRQRVARFTSDNVGKQFAYVLDGRILGQPANVLAPVEHGEIAIAIQGDPGVAKAFAEDLAKTEEKSNSPV